MVFAQVGNQHGAGQCGLENSDIRDGPGRPTPTEYGASTVAVEVVALEGEVDEVVGISFESGPFRAGPWERAFARAA